MRKGIPIAIILILSLLMLILPSSRQGDSVPEIPSQDLQVLSKLLSPFMEGGESSGILQSLAKQFKEPSILILAGIIYGEKGDVQEALALLEKAERLLPADPLPTLLHQLYDPQKPPDSNTSSLIEREVGLRLEGWFRDKPLARLYRMRGNPSEANRIEARIASYNRAILLRIALVISLWGLAFLGGIFSLLYYFTTRRKETPPLSPLPSLGWGWALAFIFIFILLSSLISSLPLLLLFSSIESFSLGRGLLPLFFLLGEIIGGVLVFYLAGKRSSGAGIPLRDLGFRLQGLQSFLWGVGGWLAAFPLVLVAFLLSSLLNAEAIGGQQDISLLFLSTSPWGKLAIAFLAIVVAPPIEEFLFRGLLYSSLREELGVPLGITLGAFFFASVHHDIPHLLPLMTLGIVLSFLYERQRSLFPPIIAHALWNTHNLVSLILIFG